MRENQVKFMQNVVSNTCRMHLQTKWILSLGFIHHNKKKAVGDCTVEYRTVYSVSCTVVYSTVGNTVGQYPYSNIQMYSGVQWCAVFVSTMYSGVLWGATVQSAKY